MSVSEVETEHGEPSARYSGMRPVSTTERKRRVVLFGMVLFLLWPFRSEISMLVSCSWEQMLRPLTLNLMFVIQYDAASPLHLISPQITTQWLRETRSAEGWRRNKVSGLSNVAFSRISRRQLSFTRATIHSPALRTLERSRFGMIARPLDCLTCMSISGQSPPSPNLSRPSLDCHARHLDRFQYRMHLWRLPRTQQAACTVQYGLMKAHALCRFPAGEAIRTNPHQT